MSKDTEVRDLLIGVIRYVSASFVQFWINAAKYRVGREEFSDRSDNKNKEFVFREKF